MTVDALLAIVVLLGCMTGYAAVLAKLASSKRLVWLPLESCVDQDGAERLEWNISMEEATSR